MADECEVWTGNQPLPEELRICPIMTRPITYPDTDDVTVTQSELFIVYCKKGKCIMWADYGRFCKMGYHT